jgi:polygalacturonase
MVPPPRACAAALLALATAAPVYDVTTFGARGDGQHDDTVPVRAAFSAAAAGGPGSVLFPASKTFLTGAFNLSSDLVVDIRGTVLATPDSDGGHYVLMPNLPWFDTNVIWQAFIHSDGANNITLRGGGVVDGNGAPWWACGCVKQPPPPEPPSPSGPPCNGFERPRLVNLIRGTGLVVRDLTFQNSPMWNLRPSWFDDVLITNVTILAPPGGAQGCNTDGIDPDGTQNMLVEDSYINVGDDAIAVKSGLNWLGRTYGRPSRNLTFRNLRIGKGHGISVGSEMSAGVYDVLFEDIVMDGTATGPRVKTERGRGGLVSNITFRNITMTNVGSAFQITEYYIDPPPPGNASSTPAFVNITLENVIAGPGCKDGVYLDGIPESLIHGLTLRNVDVSACATPMQVCNFTQGVCEGSVKPSCPPCLAAGGD